MNNLLYSQSYFDQQSAIGSILPSNLIYVCPKPLTVFNKFKILFNFTLASGGVVQNNKKELLMICKNNMWDLPKGHVHLNEDFQECALREVQEETGVKSLKVMSSKMLTHHIYRQNFPFSQHTSKTSVNNKDKMYLKETKWFLMNTYSDFKLVPQYEEGITDVRWIPLNQVSSLSVHNSILLLLSDIFGI